MRRRDRRRAGGMDRRRGTFQLGRSLMAALVIVVLVLIILRLLGVY
jgi:hypothetical protein